MTTIFLFDLATKQKKSINGAGNVRFASRPTTAILRKSKTAEILTTEKSRDRNPGHAFRKMTLNCTRSWKNIYKNFN